MIINTNDLIRYLSDYQPRVYGINSEIEFDRISEYPSEQYTRSIYILQGGHLKDMPPDHLASLYVCLNADTLTMDDLPSRDAVVIALGHPAKADDVKLCIQKLIVFNEKRLQFENQIMTVALSSDDLKPILKEATKYFGIPFAVYDVTTKVIAHSYE